jgi:glycerophosphoryl diester phosphodiesterase
MTSAPILPSDLLILGHRGASRQAPENTRVALERAIQLGADGVEVDVQRAADGTLVLVHDDDWLRTAGVVADVAATPWSEARRFDVGRWFDASFVGTPPARLEDALEVLPPEALLNLELKAPRRHPGLGMDVLAALRHRAKRPRVLITSFAWECIDALVGIDPDIELGYLGTEALPGGGAVKTRALAYTALLEQPEIVSEIHGTGGRIFAWTVDDLQLAKRLADLEVDGLISNDPAALRPERTRL